MEQEAKSLHINVASDVSSLDCPGFKALTQKERLYAYYFSRAAWQGAKICYFQRSYEAPGLFYILQHIFRRESPQELGYRLLMANQYFSAHDIKRIYAFIAGFFQNCGNYTSFGDQKFTPEVSKESFWTFVTQTRAYTQHKETFEKVWKLIENETFSWQKPFGLIDLEEKEGKNSYYSPSLSAEFIGKLDQQLREKNLSVLNTRVVESDGRVKVLVASVERSETKDYLVVDDRQVDLVYGDFSSFLKEVAHNLQLAASFTATKEQDSMLKEYNQHFIDGDIEKHKQSQRHWIQDRGPKIETNIGFIETYLDPLKVRAEFEGFVSIVNQEESALLNNLVDKAEKYITYLPWPKEFECDTFKRPDFTSLEVITFACSGTPVGINIPNYDDIRQNLGFKNVNLGNVYGTPNRINVKFLSEEDVDVFVRQYRESLFVVVALHELIGHGSGKLFMKDENGALNFDPEAVKHPFTGEIVKSHYEHNEQWHSRFGELSGAYEECKADAVALYLSTFDDVVEVLLPNTTQAQREETVYAAWLDIVYSSLKGLEYYSVEQQKWGQPHVLASFVITSVIRAEDPDFIKFEITELNEKPYLRVSLDRSKIWTVGKKAIGKLLLGLQVYKSVGDGEGGLKFFNQYTQVSEELVKIRSIVTLHKSPRRLELQHDLKYSGQGQEVELIEFEKSFEGIIQSYIAHYQGDIEDVLDLFLSTQQLFRSKQ